MRGTNDVGTTAGCLESLTDLMPEAMAHEVKLSIVDWSDDSESSGGSE